MAQKAPFNRLLVANRGEIAIRIFRAASELGIRTIGVYSFEDRFALYRFKADEAYRIGEEGKPLDAYLNKSAIVALAVEKKIDAIHPGYGFLSEDAEFAQMCADHGIVFIGPSVDVLRCFGDKVLARRVAQEAEVPVIPGTQEPIASLEEAVTWGEKLGFPLTLKAVSGGGGKGIRMIENASELANAFERAKSEAKSSFGKSDVYVEKCIVNPRHIEVQILADQQGNAIHLFERDCSIQRRHQKVVEVAPAFNLADDVRQKLYHYALKIAEHVKYQGLGTVEFLVGQDAEIYFLEVNPRVQVEHTVTEMITGIDLLQASILVAAGESLHGKELAIGEQKEISYRGAAIQCRITTEDPLNQFAPDTGEIIAYRPACGFGIRLDEGHGTAGGIITPHYDSLLVKVTAWGRDLQRAAKKMHRSLAEFRIRGVKHNIPLLRNVVTHEDFLAAKTDTSFLESHPDLYTYKRARDRATKLLRYIADVTVNNPHDLANKTASRSRHLYPLNFEVAKKPCPNAKSVFDQGGAEALKSWIFSQQSLLLTDTTMRDAHQSLFATRLRTTDIMTCAPYYQQHMRNLFSLEMWGGATFDTCFRFLKEDPWERLAKIRQAIPDVLLQMLIRGDNAVGYTHYPEWVVRDFIRLSRQAGMDVFRIFDCLNQPEKMRIAIDAVKSVGAIAEVCLCYTGNVIDPRETKFTLSYYLNIAKEVTRMGADILAIKDMAGLLRPKAAEVLIKSLRETIDIPIHLHMHDTAGVGVTTLMEAAQAGCQIVDAAVSSMSGLTSQPSMNALVASMTGDPRCPQVSLHHLDDLARYWADVRRHYRDFDPGIQATSTDVYQHEIPGGQYSNLYQQAQKLGVSAQEFFQLTERYREVNELLGGIVKVTPSSKVVGDFALLLQKQNLTKESYLREKPKLDYPDSVLGFVRGDLGEPFKGIPKEVKDLILATDKVSNQANDEVQDSYEQAKQELASILEKTPTEQQVVSYRLYPKVFKDYWHHRQQFGDVTNLATPVFFYGLEQGDEYETELEPGKTLIIRLNGLSEADNKGMRTAFFDLNGYPREISIQDIKMAASLGSAPRADPSNPHHVGASMPGKVLAIKVKTGQAVEEGDVLLVTESMKMEYSVTAKTVGSVEKLHVEVGSLVEEGDLLLNLRSDQ